MTANVYSRTRAVDVVPLILLKPDAIRSSSATMFHVSVRLRELRKDQYGEFYRDETHEGYFASIADVVTHVERVTKNLEQEGEVPPRASMAENASFTLESMDEVKGG